MPPLVYSKNIKLSAAMPREAPEKKLAQLPRHNFKTWHVKFIN
jgi:hypothetical protein